MRASAWRQRISLLQRRQLVLQLLLRRQRGLAPQQAFPILNHADQPAFVVLMLGQLVVQIGLGGFFRLVLAPQHWVASSRCRAAI